VGVLISVAFIPLVAAQEKDALSVLSGDTLRDVQGPVNFPANYTLFFVLLFLFLAAMGIFIYRRLKSVSVKTQAAPVDDRTPWQIAYDDLDTLRTGGLLEEGRFKEYYSTLSNIIRSYFERRFNVRAPEMTTEEFLWSLEASQELSADQKSTLKKFLNSCDVVKFAKYVPPVQEARDSLLLAEQLVKETRPAVSSTL
jgi:hypothetical protein